jgi:hypothetical protein
LFSWADWSLIWAFALRQAKDDRFYRAVLLFLATDCTDYSDYTDFDDLIIVWDRKIRKLGKSRGLLKYQNFNIFVSII